VKKIRRKRRNLMEFGIEVLKMDGYGGYRDRKREFRERELKG